MRRQSAGEGGTKTDFRILGPLEVAENGLALDLGGPKQRALLAMLLLHAGEVVSSDRLIEALWEEDVPETAQKALQVHVSGLRKLLGKERLQTRAPGYLLRLEPGELDLERFQALRAQGKPHEALALWRGPPLQDVAYSRFARSEIARLEEERLACLEERIEAELAAGRHAELVGELEALVREHPLRERLRAQLMLSLYRCGRQAEALECYQDARRALTEELGLEPGRALRELEQAILNQDPGLEQPRAEPTLEVQVPGEDLEPPPALRETRKTVTVLCAGLGAATSDGARLDPEALRRVLALGFDRVRAAAERHGGSVDAQSGTALTVVFGVPAVHEDDAERALRAADEARRDLEELAGDLLETQGIAVALRLGLSTGEVVVGGSLQPVGGPLTDALQLAEAAGPGQVLLDEATHRLAREVAVVEPIPEGLHLLSLSLQPAAESRLRSPMVGRARERRRLHDAFDQAVGDRSCQLFTVLGAPGVGKSRLAEEFLADVTGEARVIRGRCLPYGEGITYWPVMEAVKEAVGLDDSDSPEEARAKLVVALQEDVAAARLAEMIGLAEGSLGAEEGFSAVGALFEALAREHPLVVVFDDVHWAERTFLELVEHLSDWMRGVPMLLLCLARPELLDTRPGWAGGKLNATTILLEPLSEDESRELVENLAGVAVDEPTRLRIVEAAEGNPLFVEEMLALALERGAPVEELIVPPTIQALLAARLDRLADDERAVIERAAVEGKVFSRGALEELSPEELRPGLEALLGSLLRKELIRADRPGLGGRTYRFRHLLIRDAAYESIPKAARADMHERFGRWFEGAAGDRAVEYGEVVGYHFEQAYRYRAELGQVDEATRTIGRLAAERLGAAGQRAFIRSDAPAGVNLISRAVALVPTDDLLRVDLIPNVRVVQGLGELSWADRVLTEAVEAAATSGNRALAAHALVQRGLLRLFTESDVTPEELLATAARAQAVFEELADELGLTRAWRLAAQARYLAKQGALSVEASERALEHARRAGDRFEQREIEEWLLIALLWGPEPVDQATSRCERLLDACAGDPAGESQALGGLVYLLTMSGRLDEAHELAARARNILDELGEGIWIVSFHLAEGALLQGETAAAEAELRPIYDGLKKIGERSHFSAMAQLLAEAVYRQGRLEEADRLTRECETTARANDVHDQIRWRAIRAKVLASRGEHAAAEALSREAVARAEEGDFLVAHAGALADRAEVHALSGQPDSASAALEEAIRYHELKGNALAARQARERLGALRG